MRGNVWYKQARRAHLRCSLSAYDRQRREIGSDPARANVQVYTHLHSPSGSQLSCVHTFLPRKKARCRCLGMRFCSSQLSWIPLVTGCTFKALQYRGMLPPNSPPFNPHPTIGPGTWVEGSHLCDWKFCLVPVGETFQIISSVAIREGVLQEDHVYGKCNAWPMTLRLAHNNCGCSGDGWNLYRK